MESQSKAHWGLNMKNIKRKHWLLYVIPVLVLVSIIGLSLFLNNQNNIKRKQLDLILNSLSYTVPTYDYDNAALRGFSDIETMSDYDKARYYRALTKLYSITLGSMSDTNYFLRNAQIYAQRSNSSYISAWIYADISQVYLNISSYQTAMNCIQIALDYAKGIQMEDYFYEYCYTVLAFSYSCTKDNQSTLAKQYYKKAMEYNSEYMPPEYYSFDARKNIILAQIALAELDYETCQNALASVKDYMEVVNTENIKYFPLITYYTVIQDPYYKTAINLALKTENWDDALILLKEGFAVAERYSNSNAPMSLMSHILPTIHSVKKEIDSGSWDAIITLANEATIKYSSLSEIMSASTGFNIFSNSEATINLIIQEYRTTHLYKMILRIIIIVFVIVGILLFIIWMIQHKANVDTLTGAYTRRCFVKLYDSLCARKKVFGLIMYDIDYFKQFNDNFGHDFGDEVLRMVSYKVMSLLRGKKAKLYRFGGDEFLIITRKLSLEEVADLAEQIRSGVEALEWSVDTNVTLSIGASLSSQCPENPMKFTDENVYVSKEAGRNKVSYTPIE